MNGSSAAHVLEEAAPEAHPASLSTLPTRPDTGRPPAAEPTDEAPPSRPWCVDLGDALEALSTFALWTALETGAIPRSTPIWREGMECWTPAGEVRELFWTLSQRDPDVCAAEACVRAVLGSGDVPSFGHTPIDPPASTPLWLAERPPTSTREHRAELSTLPSAERPRPASLLSGDAFPPISLELPASFPQVPCSDASVTPPPCATTGPSAGADPAPRPASGWRLRARTLLPDRRSVLAIAAGCAVALLSIGGAALATPPAPAPASARAGVAPRAAALAAASSSAPLPLGEIAVTSGAVRPATPIGMPAIGAGAGAKGSVRVAPARSASERGQHRLRRGAAPAAPAAAVRRRERAGS